MYYVAATTEDTSILEGVIHVHVPALDKLAGQGGGWCCELEHVPNFLALCISRFNMHLGQSLMLHVSAQLLANRYLNEQCHRSMPLAWRIGIGARSLSTGTAKWS